MVAVCKQTYEREITNERVTEILQRAPCKGNARHPAIGQRQAMGESLQGIERRTDINPRAGKFPLQCGANAIEERIARSENHYTASLAAIFPESIFERHSYVDPFGSYRKQRGHELMMALTARENGG